ncbi:MAG: hypothetical protein FWH12_07635 [Treponema sp.]|nr:hypothetical protein [Treponema sp.]
MVLRADLYSILVFYANNNNSPYVDIQPFLEFLGKNAARLADSDPEWARWRNDRSTKFWSDLSVLVEDEKCKLLTDTEDGRVYMPNYYPDLLGRAYQNIDNEMDQPFPSEESLRIILPETQVRNLNDSNDIISYLKSPQEGNVPVIRIMFPVGFGTALVLAHMLPQQLTEMAMYKIQRFIGRQDTKEFLVQKLSPQLQGRDYYLHDQIDQIMLNPRECFKALSEGRELSYLFWAHFCILLKNDIKMKKNFTSEDIGAFQSAHIIEVVNNHYKTLSLKQQELDMIFNTLEAQLAKPPYLYSLDEIIKFKNPKGMLLAGQYTRDDFEAWLKKKLSKSVNNRLPDLFIINGPEKNERNYLLKSKMFPLYAQLMFGARNRIKDGLCKHWGRMLLDYRSEPAMENDKDFDRLVARFARRLLPKLTIILDDPRLYLVFREMENSGKEIPMYANIFVKGQRLSYSALFFLRRKDILAEARLFLPFWYSIPFLTAIITFFKNLSRPKTAQELAPEIVAAPAEKEEREDRDESHEIRSSAEEMAYNLVPEGYSLNSYLEDLEARWSHLLDRKARQDLVTDVKALVKNYVRANMKVQRNSEIRSTMIHEMAVNLVSRTPALASLSSRDALVRYCELYMIKLIGNIR